MRSTLTAKQRRFLDYFEIEIGRRGGAPSLREAAADLGISHAAVARHLKVLEEKGYVKRDGYYSRTVYLLDRTRPAAGSQRWREVPIVGRVAAGLPLYAQQEWDGSLVVDRSLFRGPVLFALRIRGDSMQGVGIRDRDLAICEPRQYARDGEIVVALINGEEATVKRFFLRPDHIELRAENPAYPAMRYGFDEVLVQGKVVGILRTPQEFD